jgi:hypothetical protein
MKYPDYPKINKLDLRPMTMILEAGVNWATKGYEYYLNKYPYRPAFTHALLHLRNGICINVGLTTKRMDIRKIIKPKRFYLAIEITNLSDSQIDKGIEYANSRIDRKKQYNVYDAWGFLCFGVRKLGFKNCEGSENFDFCSDEVCDNFKAIGEPLFNSLDGEKMSPSDMYMELRDYKYAKINQISSDI